MKIGIVGGYGHAMVRSIPGVELAWACDEYNQKAMAQAQACECAQTYQSMEELLEKFAPDLVYVGSVYAQNGPLAIRALEAGLDVISEKPLATNWEVYERLKQLTASGERRVIAELSMRWTPALRRMRQLIQEGRIGSPVMIQAQKSYKFGSSRPDFYKSRRLFGGIISWVAIHAIDYSAWTTGLRYQAVTARHGNRCFPEYLEMEDHAAIQFEMTGGIPCHITADFLRPNGATSHGDDRLRITGSEGVVEMRHNAVIHVDAMGESHWECPHDEFWGVQAAKALVSAALGESEAEISTAECLHFTAAALAATEAADQQHTWQLVPGCDGVNP